MSLSRSHDRGSYVVERSLLGVRIRKRTGCQDRSEAERVQAALVVLAKHGRRDLLVAFQAGRVRGQELVASLELHGAGLSLTPESGIRLRRAMYDWLRRAALAEKTRRDYRWNLGALVGKLPPLEGHLTPTQERSLGRGPVLTALPRLLTRYAGRARPSQFIQVKAACQAFLRDTEPHGRQSELWRAVTAVRGPKRSRREVQGGLSPERAREVAERLGKLGPMWWTLCCTGMEMKEYWRRRGWEVLRDRILIHGTKREARDRIVPRLTTPVRPMLGLKAFRKRLRAVGEALGLPVRLRPYDARRTFTHWMELSGILRSRREAYLGHSPKDDLAKYEEHDVVPYLAVDTKAMREKIGADPVYVRVVA